ncbi:hypothetical protein Y032_0014g2450 [Ancylostoma ceylanicum]|uniref:RNA-directed DNA polymerase n=1 Tax=Ancylostoma ceylanicum TaxID=53326 RepID=A0A016V9J5_9BILA|nr:hypothetical protein Y032_0014g2450 [Ancylostoma ceylanicum]
MDPQAMMSMFRDMMREERKEMMEMFFKHLAGQGQGSATSEVASVPSLMSALSNRIDKFVFDPDTDMCFTRWYSRYKEVFVEDAKQLSESARVRLLCEKMDSNTFEKYQRHVLPKEVTSISFEESVETLKQLFDVKASEFTTRYQCLKLEKGDSEDYLTYTGRVNEFCERARIHELDCDGIKCLLWIFGLKSQRKAEIRQRLIAVLDREYKAGRKLSLQELYRECENFLSLKKDSETIAGNVKTVEAAAKEERRKRECWNCCGDHFAQQCKSKPWFCKVCKKTGHKERFCEVANRRKAADNGSEGRRSRQNSDNRRNKKTIRSSGKHVRGVKIANATAEVNSTRMYVEARVNQHPVSFLLDTGSDITLLNEDVWRSMGSPKLENTSVVVKNASGSSMKIHGKLWCDFEIKGSRSEGYAYVTPHNSLLGLEWIQKNEDMSYYMRMMVAEVKANPNEDVAMKLKEAYPEVFEEVLGLCTKEKADLQLVGDVRPVFKACRPVPHAAVEAVEKELDRLLEMQVIEPVTHSEWAAPIVCVRKSNGKLRVCADFSTGLNKALESFDYPLPVPEDIFATLNGGAVFSQIDLSDAYLQIELSDESKKMVVINTHRGLFQYNRLPFGIKTAPGIFQQIMNKMVAGLRGVATYLDDILVCGRTEQEHTENLLALFERIAEYGFKVRLEKCSFAKPEIRYLGFIVDKNGRRPNPEKIEAIKSMVEPKNVGQLRAFLGMITYYAAFMPTMKDLRGPLDALLKKDVKWEWTSKQQTAFEKLKKALSSELNLAHYDPRQKIVVAADACDYGIGCVISHRYADGSEKPIAHASRSLTAAEKNYSQIEKEALGIVFAVKKFHKYVLGRKFLLLTDHKPLLAIFGDKKGVPVYSANRLMRWATILLGYDFDIEYVNTTKFGQADGLSRLMRKHQVENEDIVIASVENDVCTLLKECMRRLPVTVDDVESYTRTDPVLRKVISCVKSGKWPKVNQKLAHFHNRRETLSVVGSCVMSGERVVIPPELRSKVLKELHVGHPGIVRMKKLARSYVYWPNIDSDCEDMVRRCTSCQEAAKNPMKVALKTWPSPTRVWQRVHVDFAGPLQGIYYLVVVDAFSKWPEMIEMSNISASKTVKALKSLFARYGLPQTIVSDNGTQFTSEQFKAMCDEGGIVHIKTAPYHPQSNGQAERFVDTLKRGIKKLKGEERPSEETLNVVLQAYRTTPNSSLNERTPAEVFLGRKLRTRLSLLVPQPESDEDPLAKARRERMEQQFDRKHGVVKRTFQVGDKVYAKQWKQPQFHWMKGTVMRRIGSVNYEVEIYGRIVRKHANQLRFRDGEGHKEGSDTLKVLLEALAAEDAYTGREVTVEPNPDRAIPNARQPADPTSTVPPTQGPPPPTLRRSTRIRRPVQRFDPSPA